MIKIAIVDDEKEVRQLLEGYIRDYAKISGEKFEISQFSDGLEVLSGYKPYFDIIFLDIQMAGMDGMAAAERIRAMDEDVLLVFITNMANYAIRGYAVNAMDFVIKPVSSFAFSQQLSKATRQLRKKKDQYLVIQQAGGIVKFDVTKILYIESLGHRLIIHSEKEDFTFNESLKRMEERLDAARFVRCNNCYLVNLSHVESVQQEIATVGGHKLKISRPRKNEFMSALADYIGGVVR